MIERMNHSLVIAFFQHFLKASRSRFLFCSVPNWLAIVNNSAVCIDLHIQVVLPNTYELLLSNLQSLTLQPLAFTIIHQTLRSAKAYLTFIPLLPKIYNHNFLHLLHFFSQLFCFIVFLSDWEEFYWVVIETMPYNCWDKITHSFL